jgi:Na+/H+-dicarboxylate symporter
MPETVKMSRFQQSGETVFRFFNGGAEIMYMVVHWILQYAPIGVFALIADVFGKQGAEAFGPLGWTTLAIYLAFVGHMLVVYGGMLLIYGLSPLAFYSKAKEAIVTAFVTRSSGGTLPVSMETAGQKMGISQGVYSFSCRWGPPSIWTGQPSTRASALFSWGLPSAPR